MPAAPGRRTFAWFWTGDTLATFGTTVGTFAIPVLAVQTLGASELQVGLLTMFSTLAFLVIGLPAGAWLDRWSRVRTMGRATTARAALLSTVPLLWVTGALQFWHLAVIATGVGVCTVFSDVASQSAVPVLVAPDRVVHANSRLETTGQVARISGPAVSGGLLGLLAAPLVLLLTALTYVGSAVALGRVRADRPRPTGADRPGLAAEIRAGLSWVLRQPLLVRIVACTALSNLSTTIATTMLPVLVLRELAVPATTYGLIASVGALGGVLGALATPRLAARVGEGIVIGLAAAATGIAVLALPAALVARDAAVVILCVFEVVLTFSVVVYNVTQVSFRQRLCPPELLGRMNASVRFLVWGVLPVAGLLSGVLAESLGLAATLWIAAAGTCCAALPVLLSPLRGMRVLPDAPAR